MSLTGEIREAMSLWLEFDSESDIKAEIERFSICRAALDDFLALKISLENYLEVLADQQVNVDEYRQTADENLGLILPTWR
jgi:hypothetical protein